MAAEGTPPQPKAVLRGHKAQVHAAAFVRGNDRLVTGDADGFVVVWDLTIMRPRAVWQAHTNAILGAAGWGSDRIITHGRDNKLIVWKLSAGDEAALSTALPLDQTAESRTQPWMLHLLEVNTMNFCTFSSCAPSPGKPSTDSELLIAVPNTLASEAIDIFELPSQRRIHTVKLGDKNGMVMALCLFHQGTSLTLAAGYENGLAVVATLNDAAGDWTLRYRAQCHSQPVLSLDVSLDKTYFLTSSADATIAKHPVPGPGPSAVQIQNVPSPTTPETREKRPDHARAGRAEPVSLLSAALAGQPRVISQASSSQTQVQSEPIKLTNTKHAGQQGLRIRSDGRIFATAGWDSRVRVYSTKTLKEVAVLKWHQVGCFAVAFSSLDSGGASSKDGPDATTTTAETSEPAEDQQLVDRPTLREMSVKERRIRHAETAHWLAAGSKDGKVSLWDVF